MRLSASRRATRGCRSTRRTACTARPATSRTRPRISTGRRRRAAAARLSGRDVGAAWMSPAHGRRSSLLSFPLSACAATTAGGNAPGAAGSEFRPPGPLKDYGVLPRRPVRRARPGVMDTPPPTGFACRAARDPAGSTPSRRQAFVTAYSPGGQPGRDGAELADNPLAQLYLADGLARAGRWDAAGRRFAALPDHGLTRVLRPLLVAWALQGAGRTDAALDSCGR